MTTDFSVAPDLVPEMALPRYASRRLPFAVCAVCGDSMCMCSPVGAKKRHTRRGANAPSLNHRILLNPDN